MDIIEMVEDGRIRKEIASVGIEMRNIGTFKMIAEFPYN